jgi:hypothetical protein
MSGIKIKELNFSLDVGSLLEMFLRLLIDGIAAAYRAKQPDAREPSRARNLPDANNSNGG